MALSRPPARHAWQAFSVRPETLLSKDKRAITGLERFGQSLRLSANWGIRTGHPEIGSEVGVESELRELTVAFTAAGAVLVLLGAVLSTLWFARLP